MEYPSPVRSHGVSESKGATGPQKAGWRPPAHGRKDHFFRPHHGKRRNAVGGPESCGVVRQWYSAGTASSRSAVRGLGFPWDVWGAGRSSVGSEHPIRAGPVQGLWVPGWGGCRPLEEWQCRGHLSQGSEAEGWCRRRQRFLQVTCHVRFLTESFAGDLAGFCSRFTCSLGFLCISFWWETLSQGLQRQAAHLGFLRPLTKREVVPHVAFGVPEATRAFSLGPTTPPSLRGAGDVTPSPAGDTVSQGSRAVQATRGHTSPRPEATLLLAVCPGSHAVRTSVRRL